MMVSTTMNALLAVFAALLALPPAGAPTGATPAWVDHAAAGAPVVAAAGIIGATDDAVDDLSLIHI